MSTKLVAIDLDGTLLSSNNTISLENKRVIQAIRNKGVKVVLASGRPLSGVMPYEQELGIDGKDEHAVVFNGAVVQTLAGQVLMSKKLTYQDFLKMLKLQRLAKVNLHFETTECFYTCDRDLSVQMQINASFTNNVMKVRNKNEIPQDFTFNKVGFTCDLKSNEIEKLWRNLPAWAFEKYDIVRSAENCIELNTKGASKGDALVNLANRLGIAENEVMIFGDQDNDRSMFANPNFKKIAMGNAISSIKEQADYITATNDANGVAKALKKFVL
ncbi:Cof-type HAD-IIB family hydrolase [Lactobacillus sp. PV034]|uniref:Cof-type HAD-IIB family hydrolase n=1 Tax=Lactobacillus sp. PV034 TaxID=2594495 RepID=UPI00223EE927|nr:Cof-type HAD-IIB family hydrolase [Lactobacillus sp. PV034]QNQ80366.1 HAD family phosphatase [Lactobacillus sp. PV034]